MSQRRMGRWPVAVALLAVLHVAIVQQAHAELLDASRLKAEKLPNGWVIAAYNIPQIALVHIGVFQSVGVADDPPGMVGITHLIEHLVASDSRYAADLALNTCYANAFTEPEMTWYETICIPARLARVLHIEADRHRSFAPTQEQLDRERAIVRTELASRHWMDPVNQLGHAMIEAVHGWSFRDRDRSLAKVELEDVVEFHRQRIAASRHVLVVVGPTAVDEMLALARTAFAHLPATAAVPATVRGNGAPAESVVTLNWHEGRGFWLGLGYEVPTSTAEERALALLCSTILAPDADEVPLRRGRSKSVLIIMERFQYRGALLGYGSSSTGQDEALARAWLGRWVAGRADSASAPRTFGNIRQQALRKLEEAFRNPRECSLQLGSALVFDGDLDWLAEVDRMISRLRSQDIGSFLEQNVLAGPGVCGVVYGRGSGRVSTVSVTSSEPGTRVATDDPLQGLDPVAVRRALEAEMAVPIAKPRAYVMPNKITVTVLDLPGASQLWVAALKTFPPLASERSGKRRGLCSVYSTMVNLGDMRWPFFGSLPYQAVFLGSPWELQMFARGPANSAGGIAFSLVKILRQRQFDSELFHFLANNAQQMIAMSDSPETNAQRARWGRIFGEDHPVLGAVACDSDLGTKASLADLRRLVGEMADTGNLQWFAVGDAKPVVVDLVFGPALAGLPARKLPKWKFRDRPEIRAPVGDLVTARDALDVTLTLDFGPVELHSEPRLTWTEARTTAAYVESRLSNRLRMERGLVYGVRVEVVPIGGLGLMEIETAALSASAVEVMALVRDEAQRLFSEPVDGATLDRVKLVQAGYVLHALTRSESALDLLVEMGRYGEPEPEPVRSIVGLSAERVHARLSQWFAPGISVFSVVAPADLEDLEPFERAARDAGSERR